MSSTDAAWDDLNNDVLGVFTDDRPRTTGEVERDRPGLPSSYVRAALTHNAEFGYLTARRGAVHTTYTRTETGRARLADTKAMA